jgi:glycerol transport system ATP-binding protein
MAEIRLDGIAHSYDGGETYALEPLDMTWEDGKAYAILGPSGCGKSTLLNIMSGILQPSEGRVLIDNVDVTETRTAQRNIAQVFQFPVLYETMTVRQNLAFPLKNRGYDKGTIAERVASVAELLSLTDQLDVKPRRLRADLQQIVSLGRGLVRPDVAAILFDEPLTVIDPTFKWMLRSKLKQMHHETGHTLVYVTHDQTEALTFADEVIVLNAGQVVQQGELNELFLDPSHEFVGHFIGSPGMNMLPATVEGVSAASSPCRSGPTYWSTARALSPGTSSATSTAPVSSTTRTSPRCGARRRSGTSPPCSSRAPVPATSPSTGERVVRPCRSTDGRNVPCAWQPGPGRSPACCPPCVAA